jgi:alkyldihydroxyacetonephosphate synthase
MARARNRWGWGFQDAVIGAGEAHSAAPGASGCSASARPSSRSRCRCPRMSYLRDMLVRLGVLADSFEGAITWERLRAFHEAVVGATRVALGERCR